MSADIKEILSRVWERYVAPDTNVSAEFPSEPWVDEHTDEDQEEISLSLDWDWRGKEIKFDLMVAMGQQLKVDSSDKLAAQLRAQLRDDESFEIVAIEPRPYEDFAGALQYMRLRETGELFLQWLISIEDGTVFAGVTFADKGVEAIAKKFLDSVSLSIDEGEQG